MIKPYTSKYSGAGHSVLLCGQNAVQAASAALGIPGRWPATPAKRRAMPPFPGAGYMIYKGFSRMGQRMERSSAVLGKQLKSAVRRGWVPHKVGQWG